MSVAGDEVRWQVADGLCEIRLNRPQVLNALSMSMLASLRQAIERAGNDPTVRCVVLRGEGRAFCTGSDLAAPRPGLDPDRPEAFLAECLMPVLEALHALEVPTLAAVNGVAAGAGMSLALACDIVVAGESAYFLQPFVEIGLVPDLGSSWLLPASLGRARAAGLVLLGERLPARTAADWGLVWQCVPDAAFDEQLLATARRLAAQPPAAMRLSRGLLRQASRTALLEQARAEVSLQGERLRSDEHREARARFGARRKTAA